MLLDLEALANRKVAHADPVPVHDWSVLVPFFNERAYLASTIASLAGQSRTAKIILIDNGSTDDSGAIARAECRRFGLDYLLIEERTPGKVAALRTGLRAVRSPYVATCDADTWYPADYLAEAQRLLETKGTVVAGAFFATRDMAPEQVTRAGRKMVSTARLLPRQCHTGGAGQAFETAALRRAGGFDGDRWGYVLEDHEIIHRMMKHGRMAYSEQLWCAPSSRERDRESIRWTLAERLLYSAAAPWAGDWFFYRFLASRLHARRLTSERIRERQFQEIGRILNAAYPVCG